MNNGEPVTGFSFCIITNGRRPRKLLAEIASVHAMRLSHYEILVGGKVPAGLKTARVEIVDLPDLACAGRLGAMRNRLVERARFDTVVVADDDMLIDPEFCKAVEAWGDDFDVLVPRIINPDGTRFWDWAAFGGPRGHVLLDYGVEDEYVYVTGGMCIMKRHIHNMVQWDDDLLFYQGEDVDFSSRLHMQGLRIDFVPGALVVHDDWSYTQNGLVVSRYMIRNQLFNRVRAILKECFSGKRRQG